MNNDIAIKVDGVSKSFRLPHEKSGSIKGALVGWRKRKRGYENQHVLEDISFEIKKGEFFGIVGRNGSGKSTLLKLISQIYTPDKGSIVVNGKLTPFIELGVGFNPELSGRDNVYLNGALLGFDRNEMEAMYDEIVEFAELERFMDQKLKNYSSGMQVRLAFSIAIRANTDILVLDEVLAVGDEAFQRKCFSYFAQLKKQKKTVILVTHDMGSVQRFCTGGMLIDGGEIIEYGDIAEVTRRYQELNRPKEDSEEDQKISDKAPIRTDSGEIQTKILKDGGVGRIFYPDDTTIRIESIVKAKTDIKDAFLGLTIWKENGEPVFWYTTEKPNPTIDVFEAASERHIVMNIQNIFGDGKYDVSVSVKSNDRSKEYIVADKIGSFEVAGHGTNGWMLHPDISVEIS